MNLMSNHDEKAIEEILHMMRTDDSRNAPADAIRWSKNIFRARAAEPKKSLVSKIFAVLQMDLSQQNPAFGERSASAARGRQMLFQAGENAVDLRIAEVENGFALRGQILGEGFANCAVKLGDFETTATALGEFKFTEVPGGNFNLILRGENEIVIENLELN